MRENRNMKKKISTLLAFILVFCMSIPVFAAPSNYPTTGDNANQETIFTIQKKYVKQDGNTSVSQFPEETLKFTTTCIKAPTGPDKAPALTVDELKVTGVTNDITVHVPAYSVPGKYNYKIVEQSPMIHTAGVLYDKNPIYLQVVVKYDNGDLKKIVTVANDGTIIGNGNDKNNGNGNKKADFKNKYLLDGEIDPEIITPNPDPNPNPIPDPGKDPIPGPDPVKPIPTPDGGNETVEHAKFKIMKHVRGPLASRDEKFTVQVTLKSDKPVRSDITYNDGTEHTISKVGSNSSQWNGTDITGYTASITLSIKNNQTVEFKGVPAGISYTVQEDSKHIGKLDENTMNAPSKGYTVCYYGGGNKVNNPTAQNPGDYGKSLFASGTVGRDRNNNIIISNSKGLNDEDKDMVKPNTGINMDSIPYFMILGLVVLGAGVMVIKNRRRSDKEE